MERSAESIDGVAISNSLLAVREGQVIDLARSYFGRHYVAYQAATEALITAMRDLGTMRTDLV